MNSIRRKLAALGLAAILFSASAGSAAAATLDESACGDLYSLSRSGSTVRIVALSSDVRLTWGSGRYGTTKVWSSATGSGGAYKGAWNTSSTGGANFPVSSSNKWWTLALVDQGGYEWCRGLYYK